MILDRHPNRSRGKLRAIGYWAPAGAPGLQLMTGVIEMMVRGQPLPRPQDYVDPHWNEDERRMVVAYLDHGDIYESWMGYSWCRFDGCKTGHAEMGSTCRTDGTFVWPAGFSHYLIRHHVRPPQEFVDHVRANHV